MNRRSTFILILFGVLGLINLSGQVMESKPAVLLTKPFLVTLLALFFFFEARPFRDRFPRLILSGLSLSVAGDVFLMFQGNLYFLLGLSSFLLAHLCYLGAFLFLASRYASPGGLLARRPLAAVPLLIYLFVIAFWLWGGLPDGLRIPVVAYAAVITSMALSCLNLLYILPASIFRSLFSGVLLFLASDSFLATDRFMGGQVSLPFPGLLIMGTYLAAQYLIARSSVVIATRQQPVEAAI